MNEIANYPSLKDKLVLITGGASGIGENIVENFLQQGSMVVFLDKEKELGLKLSSKLSNYNHKAIFKECDLVNIEDLKSKINQIREEIGLISILVNNAANDERHDIDSVTPEIEKQQLERQCIKRMLEPNDIAKPVLFFASDQSLGCTAQNYVVDGGVVN